MENKDAMRLLECIQHNLFCEEANRSYEYCQNTNCTDCQIEFCMEQLEDGKELVL